MVSVSASPAFCRLLKQGSTREKLESDVWSSSPSGSPSLDMSSPHFHTEYESAGTSYRASGGSRWAVNPRSDSSDTASHILSTTLPVNVSQRRHSAFFEWRGGSVERESMESRSDVEYMENFQENELFHEEKEPNRFLRKLSSFGCFGGQ
ncbi:hypothetical protein BSKO_06325 [Bryopsis sp. KO-2023]|nr:hypothetical protein BSKO_06325 [Bryopsis sp. KO-2023]